MIIEWKKNGPKVIPAGRYKKGENPIKKNILLLPGMNEIDDDLWKAARKLVLHQIGKYIIEHHAQVSEQKKVIEDPETKEKKEETVVEIKSKEFKKLDISRAIEIVQDTWNIDTLKKWEKEEGRDSVRAEIKNQIEKIEKFGEDRKGKNKGEEI